MDKEIETKLNNYAVEIGDMLVQENPAVTLFYRKLFIHYISDMLPMGLSLGHLGIIAEPEDLVRAYEVMLNTAIDILKFEMEDNKDKNTGPS